MAAAATSYSVAFLAPPLRVSSAGPMTQARLSLGKRGEDLACRALRRRGYAVLARRYRTRWGEIDIVARDGDTLVFVEVKTRRSTGSAVRSPQSTSGSSAGSLIWLAATCWASPAQSRRAVSMSSASR